jgi:hypothetical protein
VKFNVLSFGAVMKRTALALTLILALLVSIVGVGLPEVASANPLPPYKPPAITVSSPSPTTIYNVTIIPLTVTVQVFGYTYTTIEMISWLNYSLDGKRSNSDDGDLSLRRV